MKSKLDTPSGCSLPATPAGFDLSNLQPGVLKVAICQSFDVFRTEAVGDTEFRLEARYDGWYMVGADGRLLRVRFANAADLKEDPYDSCLFRFESRGLTEEVMAELVTLASAKPGCLEDPVGATSATRSPDGDRLEGDELIEAQIRHLIDIHDWGVADLRREISDYEVSA